MGYILLTCPRCNEPDIRYHCYPKWLSIRRPCVLIVCPKCGQIDPKKEGM